MRQHLAFLFAGLLFMQQVFGGVIVMRRAKVAAGGSGISFISQAADNAETVTIGTHASGDLLLGCACREGSATPPSLPAGWTSIASSASAEQVSSTCGYKVAASGSETSGTWTNAIHTAVAVYRGQHASPIGGIATSSGGSATLTYASITMSVGTGSSWVVLLACDSWGGGTIDAPSGFTNRTNYAPNFMNIAFHDTNAGVSSYAGGTAGMTGGGWDNWQTRTIEIKAQ